MAVDVFSAKRHPCPGGCGRTVDNKLFACGGCWYRLPGSIKAGVTATAHLPIVDPERSEAVIAAMQWYGDNAK